MTFEQIKVLATSIIASLGGVAGIVVLINRILGIIETHQKRKGTQAIKENTSALGSVKEDMLQEFRNILNCSLDVDISAKLNEVFEDIQQKYLFTAQNQNEQMVAMKELVIEMAQMMSTSRKLSEDDRLRLLETIKKSNEIIVEQQKEVKPKLKIEFSPNSNSKLIENKETDLEAKSYTV